VSERGRTTEWWRFFGPTKTVGLRSGVGSGRGGTTGLRKPEMTILIGSSEPAAASRRTPHCAESRSLIADRYFSLAYSDLASRRMGMSGSASFHSAKKSW
jgi:hypothetical protein